MKKKLLAIVLSIMLVFSMVALTACGSNAPEGETPTPGDTQTPDDTEKPGETEKTENQFLANDIDTFVGVISEEFYDDEESAVKAFLENEIDCEFLSYENKGALTADEVADVALSDDDKNGMETVYRAEVTYDVSIDFDDEEAEKPTEAQVKTHIVYLIKYVSGQFKYFVARPQVGEAITRSYYLSLFDLSRYTNCKSVHVEENLEDADRGDELWLLKNEYTNTVCGKVIRSEADETIFTQSGKKQTEWKYTEYIFEHENKFFAICKGTRGSYSRINDNEFSDEWKEEPYKDAYRLQGEEGYYETWDKVIADYVFGDNGVFEMLTYALPTMEKTVNGFKLTAKTFELWSEGDLVADGCEGYVNVKDGKIEKIYIYYRWDNESECYDKYTWEISEFGKIAAMEVPDDYLAEIENAR